MENVLVSVLSSKALTTDLSVDLHQCMTHGERLFLRFFFMIYIGFGDGRYCFTSTETLPDRSLEKEQACIIACLFIYQFEIN